MEAPFVNEFTHDGCAVVVADSVDVVLPAVTCPGDKGRALDGFNKQLVCPQV